MKNYLTNVFFGPRDYGKFHRGLQAAINELPPDGIFAGDNMFTFGRNLGFLDDRAFMDAFERRAETEIEKSVIWRNYVLCWAAKRALRLKGDFCECGCYKGITARIIVDYLKFGDLDRHFYLYDLFEHTDDMAHHSMAEHSEELYRKVCTRFAPFGNVSVIKGQVPESFTQGAPDKIAFLHIDMNNAEAELGALEALFDRVTPGAAIVFDDYGWAAYKDQKAAEDTFLAARGHQILELPTGQGLLVV